MKQFARKFALVLLILSTLITSSVLALNAEEGEEESGVLLSAYEHKVAVNRSTIKTFPFNKSSYDTVNSTIPTKKTVGSLPSGEPYVAYYPNSVTYYNDKALSVKVEVEYLGQNGYYDHSQSVVNTTTNIRGIKLENNEIQLGAFGVTYKATITFYEGDLENTDHDHLFDESRRFKIDGAVAFEDPDQSNYITEPSYGLNSRKIYYFNVGEDENKGYKLADFYRVESNGLFNIDDQTRLNAKGYWPNFQDGLFAIPLNDEDTITFTIQGKQDNLALLPSLLKVNVPYKIEWYYQKDGVYPSTPDYGPETREADIYEKEAKVSATDADLISKKDGYALDNSHKVEWTNVVFNENGTTVLKVYFKEQLKVTYHDNVADEDIFDDQEKSPLDYGVDTPKFTGTPDREGYEFLGWTTYPGDLKDQKDLLSDDDVHAISVTEEADYYAQWKPLEYTINYDKNLAEAYNEMDSHSYPYTSEKMESHENQFKADNYEFLGFTLDTPDYKDGDKLYTVDDFKDILTSAAKKDTREITLYAQWDPIYKIVYDGDGGYIPGKDGEMDPNIYHGSDTEMPSSENEYVKKGYKWVGFECDYNGKVYTDINDFINDLKTMGPGAVITLKALWKKLPTTPYEAPVTGVDR